jgi:hypothetical protein
MRKSNHRIPIHKYQLLFNHQITMTNRFSF